MRWWDEKMWSHLQSLRRKNPKASLLGFDVGSIMVGVARLEGDDGIPLDLLDRRLHRPHFIASKILEYVHDYSAYGLVIGYPFVNGKVDLNSVSGKNIRGFIGQIQGTRRLDHLPCLICDEGFTTQFGNDFSAEYKLDRNMYKPYGDMYSACSVLETLGKYSRGEL